MANNVEERMTTLYLPKPHELDDYKRRLRDKLKAEIEIKREIVQQQLPWVKKFMEEEMTELVQSEIEGLRTRMGIYPGDQVQLSRGIVERIVGWIYSGV